MARGAPLFAGVDYDLIYMKRESLGFDVEILARTLLVIARGEGVW